MISICTKSRNVSVRPALDPMRTFEFVIVDSKTFKDEIQLPSEQAAWQEARRLVRDIESSLQPDGEGWVLTVSGHNKPVFRISVRTEDFRSQSISPPAPPSKSLSRR